MNELDFGHVTVLKPAFFNRDPRRVARSLLGKLLIRTGPGGILAGRIVETEAYLGEGDGAAHSAAGRDGAECRTFWSPRSRLRLLYLWQSLLPECLLPARWNPGGVLFRALEPVTGIEQMAEARGIEVVKAILEKISLLRKISSGPGRLCEAFGITRERDNGKLFVSPSSDCRARR